ERVEVKDAETCCGFGGTFCVKYPDISARMVSDKAAAVVASGAEMLVSGDLGCLMNIAGRLVRMDSKVRVYHLAELLAGMTDVAAIGEGEKP
ncbi:MAG: (Fe-S)-binding protein, partial [Thiobacillus sp.]